MNTMPVNPVKLMAYGIVFFLSEKYKGKGINVIY